MVKDIYKKLKSILFADPKLLYQEERSLINQPFYFPGTNRKAVLLIHGWTSTSYEVRRLGAYLNESGYTVSGPLLKGHGTAPKDLEEVKWTDWLNDVVKEYEKLKSSHERVYLAGTSAGANLAAIMAGKHQDISKLILMAMPYAIKFEGAAYWLFRLVSPFMKYARKYYPPTFGSKATVTRLISYQTYPLKSAEEVYKLIKVSRGYLSGIHQPCFMIQSSSDHIVARNSLNKIYGKINSKVKKKKYLKRAYHTFISDIKNEGVFEEILRFIEEN